MKSCRVMISELKKVLISKIFIGAVLLAALLCFASPAYKNEKTGKEYTVIEAVLSADKETVESDYKLSNYYLFTGGYSEFAALFLAIIVAFPYVYYYCNEHKSRYSRFIISREGVGWYVLGKFITAFISGGLVVVNGLLIYGVIIYFRFPSYTMYAEYGGEKLIMGVISFLVSAFFFGGSLVVPSMLLCGFCSNPYVISCLPFSVIYVWETARKKATNTILMENLGERLSLTEVFRYDGLYWVNYIDGLNKNEWMKVQFFVLFILVQLVIYYVIIKKKTDRGA